MDFHIEGTRLYDGRDPVPFRRTPHQRGRMGPEGIVVHETAGHLTPGSSVSWLTQSKARASAHFVIERDGSVTQLADTDRKTWHAGKSKWDGRSGCNGFMIGIEIVGPGKLVRFGERCTAWFGQTYDIAEYGLQERRTAAHGKGWWMPFTSAQEAALTALCAALAAKYDIDPANIVGHYHVSPGRKVDPHPLFDFAALRVAVADSATTDAPRTVAKTAPVRLSYGPGRVIEDVRIAQSRLIALGYNLGPAGADGRFGSRTRAAVLAWEAENERATDGIIDAADFDALLSPGAKEMPETPVAAAAVAKAKAAMTKVDTTAAVSGATLGMSALLSDSAWGGFVGLLDRMSAAISKLAGLGVKVPPNVIVSVLCGVVLLALWRWARMAARGGG